MATSKADHGVVTEAGAIRFERLLPGPIERVWEYLVDGEKRRLWLAEGAMTATVGEPFELVWRNSELSTGDDPPPAKYANQAEYRMAGRILLVEPPHLLVQSWHDPGQPPSEVTYELEQRGAKVLLTLTHRRVESRDLLIGIAAGWHTHLDLLRGHLEGGEPKPFWRTHTRLEAEYEALIPLA